MRFLLPNPRTKSKLVQSPSPLFVTSWYSGTAVPQLVLRPSGPTIELGFTLVHPGIRASTSYAACAIVLQEASIRGST